MLNLQELKQNLLYKPETGELFKVKNLAKVIPNEGYVTLSVDGVKHKMSVSNTCWRLGFDSEITPNHKVLHRNLDSQDYRLKNLMLVDRKVYNQIHQAARNLEKNLRLYPHPVDQHCYVVSHMANNQRNQSVHHDLLSARQELLRLQLKFAKYLNTYCIFDEN